MSHTSLNQVPSLIGFRIAWNLCQALVLIRNPARKGRTWIFGPDRTRFFRVFSCDAKQEFRFRLEVMACNPNYFLLRRFGGWLMHFLDLRFFSPFRIFQNYPALKIMFQNVDWGTKWNFWSGEGRVSASVFLAINSVGLHRPSWFFRRINMAFTHNLSKNSS